MRIAVMGMGRMGQALAGRLLEAGHDLTVWNRTSGKAPDLVERGAREAGRVGEAVEGAELVFTTLANDDAVREVALGEAGVRESLPKGATYVDSSTVAPELSGELAEAFSRFVAMPILGSPAQVAEGKAIYLVGGPDAAADAVAPLFPHLSEKTLRFDRPQLAAVAKVSVNLMLLDGLVALAEAFAVGRAGGLTEDQMRDVLGASPMVAPGLRYRFEGVLTGHQEPMWSNALGLKDAGLALGIAGQAGVELPLTGAAHRRYEQAAKRSSDADIASVGELYR